MFSFISISEFIYIIYEEKNALSMEIYSARGNFVCGPESIWTQVSASAIHEKKGTEG
jgi:hypothetical protein